jgi:hypothetical protein
MIAGASDLEERVDDCEHCLAQLCERIDEAERALGQGGRAPTAADLWALLLAVKETIRAHRLGA